MKIKLTSLFLTAALLVSGCAAESARFSRPTMLAQQFDAAPAPQGTVNAVLSVKPTKVLPKLRNKISAEKLNEINTMLYQTLNSSGGFQRVEAGGDQYDYAVAGTVVDLTDLFDNIVHLQIEIQDRISEKSIYGYLFVGVNLSQSSSINSISEVLRSKIDEIRTAVNSHVRSKAAMVAKAAEVKPLPEKVVAPQEPVPPPRAGNDAYEEAKAANTFDAYEKFLKEYPSSEHRRETLEAMAALIQKRNSAHADYRKFVSTYEDGLECVPEKHRLPLTGPEGMRVQDIVALRKKGVEDNLICAKIRSGKGKYKDFSFEEMDALKKIGISAPVIEAMIDATSRVKREEEEQQKKKAMEDILAEIQRVQNKLAELKTQQPTAEAPVQVAASPASAEQSQGPSVSDTVKNCAAQVVALEACKQLPSLGAMICKAAAKSQFPCE